MNQHSTTLMLKLNLQTHGALQAAAWLKIEQLLQKKHLKANQSFIRKEGTLAYIADGLLKEYDTANRDTPAIVNFLGSTEYLVTRKYNKSHYLKACMPSIVFYWDFDQLEELYHEFRELKTIYDGVCAGYDSSVALRQQILENPSTAARINIFRAHFKPIMGYLKKKDVANYLQLNYTHFLHVNNNLP